MENERQFYINGAWIEPAGTDTLDVINPATEEAIASIALGNETDVDRAVAAAKESFISFSQTRPEERIELLEAIIEAYKVRLQDLAAAVSSEMGAPISLSLIHI